MFKVDTLHFEFTSPAFHNIKASLFNLFFPHPSNNIKAEEEKPIWPTIGNLIYSSPRFNMKCQDCGERGEWGKRRSKNEE